MNSQEKLVLFIQEMIKQLTNTGSQGEQYRIEQGCLDSLNEVLDFIALHKDA